MDPAVQKPRRFAGPIALALIVATIAAYAPLRENGFITFDDPEYVTQNAVVLRGLTAQGFAWAFNVGHAGNWHPLTWISHMVDVSWWGLDPWGHHRTSLALHALNAVLLFLLLVRMTAATWQSAFVAAAFALHPQHVESVAWVAERKDVLSTTFGLLALWVWVEWTRKGGAGRYIASIGLFALGLAAKPMIVTLPFLMLLLDFWPLRRLRGKSEDAEAAASGAGLGARLAEKIPFFALAAVSGWITVVAQSRKLAVVAVEYLPLDMRLGNAALSCASYLGKALLPTNLSVFYPYPILAGIPTAKAGLCGVLLLAATMLVLRSARRFPWLAVGWLWWLVALVPVIGIVQVGAQSMADRYTYLPQVGLSIAVAWGAAELSSRWKVGPVVAATAGGVAIAAWFVLTQAQVKLWKDSFTLFQHAAAVTEANYVAHNVLGYTYLDKGRLDEAIAHYDLAVRYAPEMGEAYTGYGAALIARGRLDDALARLTQALELNPNDSGAYLCRGQALLAQGRAAEAVDSLEAGVRLRPGFEPAERLLAEARKKRQQAGSATPPR